MTVGIFSVLLLLYCVNSTDINECDNDSGNMCSDVCVNHDDGYSCDCPTGQTLASDGQNCGGNY